MIKIKYLFLLVSILLISFLSSRINSKNELLFDEYLFFIRDTSNSTFSNYSNDEVREYKVVCKDKSKVLLFVDSKSNESYYFPIHKTDNTYYLVTPKEGQVIFNEKYCN